MSEADRLWQEGSNLIKEHNDPEGFELMLRAIDTYRLEGYLYQSQDRLRELQNILENSYPEYILGLREIITKKRNEISVEIYDYLRRKFPR